MNIRRYRHTDFDDVLELFDANCPAFFHPDEKVDLISYLDNEIEDYFVVSSGKGIVASGGINYWQDKTEGRLSWDMVHPNHQGQGIGARLTTYRLELLKNHASVKNIIVRTSQLASAFYLKQGFTVEEVHKDFWAPGIDMWRMILKT